MSTKDKGESLCILGVFFYMLATIAFIFNHNSMFVLATIGFLLIFFGYNLYSGPNTFKIRGIKKGYVKNVYGEWVKCEIPIDLYKQIIAQFRKGKPVRVTLFKHRIIAVRKL